MKHIFLFAALFLLSLSSFAQKIHFSDSTNQWKWTLYSPDTSLHFTPIPNISNYVSDTLILGMSYRKLSTNYNLQVAYIREDTIANKVYLRAPGDTSDNLLYDYTLNAGDSFYLNQGTPMETIYSVTSKDSVQINSLWYRTWKYTMIYGTIPEVPSYYVIEGIGSLNEPISPVMPADLDYSASLTCFNNGGTQPLVSPEVDGYFDNNTSCSLTFTGVKNIAANNATASIYPNPIDQTSKIVFSYNIASGSLVVLNDIGQTVINTTIQNTDEVLIGGMINTPGIYFYRVTDNESNKVFTGKFIYR